MPNFIVLFLLAIFIASASGNDYEDLGEDYVEMKSDDQQILELGKEDESNNKTLGQSQAKNRNLPSKLQEKGVHGLKGFIEILLH